LPDHVADKGEFEHNPKRGAFLPSRNPQDHIPRLWPQEQPPSGGITATNPSTFDGAAAPVDQLDGIQWAEFQQHTSNPTRPAVSTHNQFVFHFIVVGS
jgi:hypothetical protein